MLVTNTLVIFKLLKVRYHLHHVTMVAFSAVLGECEGPFGSGSCFWTPSINGVRSLSPDLSPSPNPLLCGTSRMPSLLQLILKFLSCLIEMLGFVNLKCTSFFHGLPFYSSVWTWPTDLCHSCVVVVIVITACSWWRPVTEVAPLPHSSPIHPQVFDWRS